jgi:LmbE family N-acetylglucosaminyl deacetylase
MERRKFISRNIAFGALASAAYASSGFTDPRTSKWVNFAGEKNDVIIERVSEGQPHKGKVLAVIQPHCDDIPIFAAGTVAKLISEGYTGYLIRTTNDDAAGAGASMGERVLNNEKDNAAVAKVLGLKKTYDLNYRNHRMDEYNIQEIKGRFIFLFRLLKVDTLICYDPWGHYEENPDHYITAQAVEAARWMAGMSTDYPEQLEVVAPHTVREMYYFARGPQLVNRVVDISPFIDKKVESNVVCKTQGPGGDNGARLRKRLAEEGKKLALLGDDDQTANFNYIKEFVLDHDRINGEKYGLDFAECFHYIGPTPSKLTDYIKENSVSI